MPLRKFHNGGQADIYEYYVAGKDGCLTEYFNNKKIPTSAQDTLDRLFRLLGQQGQITNNQQFKHLQDGIWEFKPKNYRVLCFFLDGNPKKCVATTHYFRKQSQKTPPKEIKKAKSIRNTINTEG
ncbi:type II toxin-antitoxin system RelE/ParE family toxin [bacterium]|nr:type II toxin-antitoxin system RelE/ParE family toxin [bacterium]NUN44650.1 type II toxin-antitoxin system RelE/ParE family toxin [bacterium]